MTGQTEDASRLVQSITNQTLGGLASVLPASKAEVRVKDAGFQTQIAGLQSENVELSAQVANLQTENAQDEAALNSLVLQVNMLTPVSIDIPGGPFMHAGPSQTETGKEARLSQLMTSCDAMHRASTGTIGINGVNGTTGPAGLTGQLLQPTL